MRKFMNLSVYANTVAMLRADIDGAIWISNEDREARFYEARCANEKARVISTPEIALEVVAAVADRGIEGVIATANVLPKPCPQNVFRPRVGDVASMLVGSTGCLTVLTGEAGLPWMNAAEKSTRGIRARAVQLARILRTFREHVDPPGSVLKVSSLLAHAIRWIDFELDWHELSEFVQKQGLKFPVPGELSRICASKESLLSELQECDGFDAIELLALATQKFCPRGIRANRTVDAETLFSLLRAAFDVGEFENDDVFWDMRMWQKTNGYALLKEWRTLDPLKILWDQRYWESDLSSLLRLAVEKRKPLAIFKADLDNFKAVNTSLGHSGGDEAIRIYCQAVRDILGQVAETYRRGGDETVAFALDLNLHEIRTLAERARAEIQLRLAKFGSQKGLSKPPTASIGIVRTDGTQPKEQLIEILDQTQQQAKDEGKNRVVIKDLLSPEFAKTQRSTRS